MSDLPRVHTGEPLVPISDDDVAYRTKMPHWTMTEALFLLTGHKPPGYESARHMQDHFWDAYDQAVRAIEMGEICRKIERAGERIFIDSPARWFAWADSLGPEFIKVDTRVRQELSQINAESRSKGGSKPKYNVALQQFIDQLAAEFREEGTPFTLLTLKKWLAENAAQGNGYDPTAAISDCDDIEFFEKRLWWKDRNASQQSTAIRTIEHYIRRANNPNLNSTV